MRREFNRKSNIYNRTVGYELIEALKAEPENFHYGYQLYEEYCRGFDTETLRPLLRSENEYIRLHAAEILAEGASAWVEPFLDEAVRLLDDDNVLIIMCALETLAYSGYGEYYLKLFEALEHEEFTVRHKAISLFDSRSDIDYGHMLEYLKETGNLRYYECISLLYDRDELREDEVNLFLYSDDPVKRKFGVMAAGRLYKKFPGILEKAADNSDEDIKIYADEILGRIRSAERRERKKLKKHKKF
ncbi:MAG: HEAT repeat domain-containing protein [Oscillospiraceae bacterium]|nr:HEAT repeat domain-containing protein [Oscillospiraceae bacterium]